jgi:hypothetical protein
MTATSKQAAQIAAFIADTAENGIRLYAAALPRNHKLIASRKVMQIRAIKDELAYGFDELGHKITLTADGRVLQILCSELPGYVAPAAITKTRAEMVADMAAKFGKTVDFAAKRLASMTDAVLAQYHHEQMSAA